MATETAPAPVKVAPRTVRMRPGQLFWWTTDPLWRRGPATPDGWWMVRRYPSVAVRLILDPEAPERTEYDFARELCDACIADRLEAEDAYLTALTTAAEIPPAELVRLRDAVRAGRAGGPVDGRRRRRGAVDPLA
jgi:hypothetical protein